MTVFLCLVWIVAFASDAAAQFANALLLHEVPNIIILHRISSEVFKFIINISSEVIRIRNSLKFETNIAVKQINITAKALDARF